MIKLRKNHLDLIILCLTDRKNCNNDALGDPENFSKAERKEYAKENEEIDWILMAFKSKEGFCFADKQSRREK